MPADRVDGVFERDQFLKEGDSLERHFIPKFEAEQPEDFYKKTAQPIVVEQIKIEGGQEE